MASEEYECTLDEASIKKAKEELNEDPKDRMGAVTALREWLLKQPHINSPTDTRFLLRFLRYKKFSQLEARKAIEVYWENRHYNAKWYHNVDTWDPKMKLAMSSGIMLLLPGRTPEGRRVLLFDEAGFDPSFKTYSKDELIKACNALLDYVTRDENTQVNGLEFLSDFTNMTLKHQMAFTLDDNRRLMKTWQGRYPSRMKAFHLYNPGAFIDYIMGVFVSLMKKKFKDRLQVHGNNLESVYKQIPMYMLPKEYLPDDYTGPCAGTWKELMDATVKELSTEDARAYILHESDPKWRVDESKRPSDVPTESFRKLNVE